MAESAVLWGTLAATGAVAWTWYYGLRATPLTAAEIAEIERHLERMRAEEAARDGKPVEEVGPWSKRNLLLRLARTDDGKEFFAVNVIRYRRQAAYPPSWTGPRGKTGAQADAIYFRKIFGALVRRACIPIFVGKVYQPVLVPNEADPASGAYDMAAILRYRSRRDFFDMFLLDPVAQEGLPHKWAGIEQTGMWPTATTMSAFNPTPTATLALLSVGLAAELFGFGSIVRSRL